MIIKKSDILKFIMYFICVICFFESEYLNLYISGMDKIYYLVQIFTLIIFSIFIIKKNYLTRILLYIALFLVILFISTIIANADISFCIRRIIKVISLCMMIDYGVTYDRRVLLNSFVSALTILNIINFISILMYPSGMYFNSYGYSENWFLGYKNSHVLYIIPWVVVAFLRSYYKNEKTSLFCLFTVITSLIFMIMTNCGTGIFGMLLLCIFIFIPRVFNHVSLFNTKNYLLIYIGLFIGIVLVRIQNVFSFLIVGVFNRDLTFTGRTKIWDLAIPQIKNHFLIGHGNVSFYHSRIVASCHNQILGILYKTGICGLIVMGLIVVESIKPLIRNRKQKVAKFLGIIFLIFLTMMLMEEYQYEYFIYFFVFCFHCEKFIKNKESEPNEKNYAC